MATALAAYDTSYLNREPYLTAAEYQNAPTAVDTSQLIPGGTTQANAQELANVIARASAWADSICYGVEGTLCATVNTEVRRIRPNRSGEIVITPDYWPILEVQSLLVGAEPNSLSSVDLSNTLVEDAQFSVFTPGFAQMTSQGPLQFGAYAPGRLSICQYTYVNGWANTTLANNPILGASSVQVTSAVGLYAGMTVAIYDGANTETVVIAGTYVGGVGASTTIPLAGTLAHGHSAGVSVSTLPATIKQAAISLTSALIKVRGAEAVVMGSIGSEPSHKALIEGGGLEDLEIAVDLLGPYRRVY